MYEHIFATTRSPCVLLEGIRWDSNREPWVKGFTSLPNELRLLPLFVRPVINIVKVIENYLTNQLNLVIYEHRIWENK